MRASASRRATPVLSHFPDEGKAARETQGPCPRSHQRDGPRQSGSELRSELPCLSLAYGEPQPLPWADALGLCLTSLGAEPSGRACRRRPGQSPAPVAWGRCWGRGQRAAHRGTCHTTTAPAACRTVTKRLETHSYFGRAFGPHLHALFFPRSPKCGARQSADVSPNKNRFDLSSALRPDVLMLSAKPRSRARSSVGGCLEKMSRRSFFSRPFRSELWGLKAGSKRSYK